VDRSQYAVEKVTAYRNLSELERDGPGVSNDSGTNLYQPGLEDGQRPVSHLLGQVGLLQEDTEIVGQCMKLKPHPSVKAKPNTTRFVCTLRVIHNLNPSAQLTC
jgi:hypothetical protein